MDNELLSVKELANGMRRSVRYVRFMLKAGFIMPGGRATLAKALEWLAQNPKPCGIARRRSRRLRTSKMR